MLVSTSRAGRNVLQLLVASYKSLFSFFLLLLLL